MTPDWLKPMDWMQMNREKQGGASHLPVPGLVGTITNSGLDLFSAWRKRHAGTGEKDRPVSGAAGGKIA